ncbi:MAG: DASH family cryptochrome [Bacteroidia bacterium]|nr:DASH family cryptochrome [Bacteroidia bacterium]
MKRAIVWFTTDLRLYNNETLVQAIAQNDEIFPVYCLDPSHFKTNKFGFKNTGNFRAKFLLESLKDLDENLREIGSGLTLLFGHPEIEINKFAEKWKAQKVYTKKQVAYYELQTQTNVEKELKKINCSLEIFSTSTLFHELDLPLSIKQVPEIFTDFRKQIEKDIKIRKPFAKPASINSPLFEPINWWSLKDFEIEQTPTDKSAAIVFKGGETEGRKRVNEYLFQTKSISNYKETRNQMIGENYSSKFSAWLSLGCISSVEIYWEIKNYESIFGANQSTYWLIFELYWRDYFCFLMQKHGHLFFLPNGIKANTPIEIIHNVALLNNWINGKTGNDFIDANMKELKLTGFLSNRGRQNVASFFCHNLKLDWRYGAAYFEEQLIDYDVTSNWCNWAYIAGVGNDPRGIRQFNPDLQANQYDKNKTYRNLWLN